MKLTSAVQTNFLSSLCTICCHKLLETTPFINVFCQMRYYCEYIYFVHKSFACVFIHTCVHKTWGWWMAAIDDISRLSHASPVAYWAGSPGISRAAVISWVSASVLWSFCGSVECCRSRTHQLWRVFWCPGICRCTACPRAFYPQPDFNHLNFNLF